MTEQTPARDWTALSNAMRERHAPAATTIVRATGPLGVLLAGGRDANSTVLAEVELYELQTNMWSPLPPLLTPRDGAVAASLGDYVIVMGGRGPFEVMDSVESWKLGAPQWEALEHRMHTARSFCSAVALPKYALMVVMGGRGNSYAELDSVEAFDLDSKEWRSLASMQTPRMGSSAVVLGENKILVMGGLNGGEWLDSMELYDVLEDSWETLPVSLPEKCGFHAATTVHDQGNTYVILLGGKNQRVLDQSFCYSVELQRWGYLPNLNQGREGCFATSVNHTVKLFGGNRDGRGATRSAEELVVTSYIRRSWADMTEEVSVDSRQFGGDGPSVHSAALFQPIRPQVQHDTMTPEVVAVPIRSDPLVSEAQVVQTTEEPPQEKPDQPTSSRGGNKPPLRKVERQLMQHNGKKVWYTGQVNEFQKPQGKGIMWNDEDGSKYMGEWWDGMREGEGKTFFAEKQSMHYGSYHRDKRHGKGKFGWKDRRVYEGDFIEDRREGRGTLTWPDGTKYEGEFRRGGPNGMGQMTFADGTVYDGQFVKGKFDGFGVCHYSDGRVYRGEFREHKAHGTGKLTDANGGVIHIGLFIDDFPVSED
mmetsp:Transcript_7878/g.18228  ORF Transcript_7878/g.18228 Transcript_7878/m.18228 type:complete len:592 (+) Transcript_7878:202-1977(+)